MTRAYLNNCSLIIWVILTLQSCNFLQVNNYNKSLSSVSGIGISHTAKGSTELFKIVTIHLDSIKGTVEFNLSCAALVEREGKPELMFYIIIRDSILERKTLLTGYTKRDTEILFLRGWTKKNCWAINLLLYEMNDVNGIVLSAYVPDKIDLWKKENSVKDSIFWADYYNE